MSIEVQIKIGSNFKFFTGTNLKLMNKQISAFVVDETLKLTTPRKGNKLKAAQMLGINRNTLSDIVNKAKMRQARNARFDQP